MNIKFFSVSAIVLLGINLTTVTCVAVAGPAVPGTYSSFEYHAESGDLVGVELKIVPVNEAYQGVIQMAEGIPKPLCIVDVEVKEDTVRFHVPASCSYPGGEFSGKREKDGIRGVLKLSNGNEMALVLKRGPGYWDR